MNDLKDKLALGSTAAVVGALVPALISLNIFATKADYFQHRAEIAEKYVTKIEQEKVIKPVLDHLQRLEDKLDLIFGLQKKSEKP